MAASPDILTFEQWKPIYEAETLAKKSRVVKGSKLPKSMRAYSPETETLPDHPWFKMDKEHIDSRISDIPLKVINKIAYAREEDKELVQLRKAAFELEKVAAKEPKAVAVVGQQAMGKSLLINAVHHRRDLSKTSAGGTACTAAAIKYRHKAGMEDYDDVYDVEVQFMDDLHLSEVAEEHGRRYYHFHFSGKVDPDYRDEEERLARTAESFFYLVFDADQDVGARIRLEDLLNAEDIENGNLLRNAIDMAHRRIQNAGADSNGIKEFSNRKIKQLMAEVQNFIAQHETQLCLSPIVQYVNLFLGSILTRNGISIIDLPGLGDYNHSRTAATNAIRRKADCELIVARTDRVESEEVVLQQIKQSIRAHGAVNTTLLLSKIDEFILDNTAIENVIESDAEHPFPVIRELLSSSESALKALYPDENGSVEEEEKEEDEEANGPSTEQVEVREGYQDYLIKTAMCTYILQRAAKMENKMRYKFTDLDPNPINVISVSSAMYLAWMKSRQKERPILTPELTGIPKLRHYLLGLSAEDNWQHYHAHVANKLPIFLDKISRIVDDEKKDDAYAVIRPQFMQHVQYLKNHHQVSFRDFLKNELARLWIVRPNKKKRLEGVTKVVSDWGEKVGWNTFNKMLRERGIPFKSKAQKYQGRTVNWNDEISREITPDLDAWKKKMRKKAISFADQLHEATRRLCGKVLESITQSSLHPPLKRIAVEEWNKRQAKVLEESSSLKGILKDEITAIYKYATTETDTRCMISKLNISVYHDIEKRPWHSGWYKKQRTAMTEALVDPDDDGKHILDRIAKAVDEYVKTELSTTFSRFLDHLAHELELFDEHIGERLPPDYDITSLDRQLRTALKALLPQLHKDVEELNEFFTVKVKTELEEDEQLTSEEPVAKRQKFTDSASDDDEDEPLPVPLSASIDE